MYGGKHFHRTGGETYGAGMSRASGACSHAVGPGDRCTTDPRPDRRCAPSVNLCVVGVCQHYPRSSSIVQAVCGHGQGSYFG